MKLVASREDQIIGGRGCVRNQILSAQKYYVIGIRDNKDVADIRIWFFVVQHPSGKVSLLRRRGKLPWPRFRNSIFDERSSHGNFHENNNLFVLAWHCCLKTLLYFWQNIVLLVSWFAFLIANYHHTLETSLFVPVINWTKTHTFGFIIILLRKQLGMQCFILVVSLKTIRVRANGLLVLLFRQKCFDCFHFRKRWEKFCRLLPKGYAAYVHFSACSHFFVQIVQFPTTTIIWKQRAIRWLLLSLIGFHWKIKCYRNILRINSFTSWCTTTYCWVFQHINWRFTENCEFRWVWVKGISWRQQVGDAGQRRSCWNSWAQGCTVVKTLNTCQSSQWIDQSDNGIDLNASFCKGFCVLVM